MQTIYGSAIAFPFRVDQRGSFATTSDPDAICQQAILAVIETRQGERVMLPDFGIPDVAFAVLGIALAERLRFHIEEQVAKYVPGVEIVNVLVGTLDEGRFVESLNVDEHHLHINVIWRRAGARDARSLVYPIWRLRNGGA